jgi:hypothetical protein
MDSAAATDRCTNAVRGAQLGGNKGGRVRALAWSGQDEVRQVCSRPSTSPLEDYEALACATAAPANSSTGRGPPATFEADYEPSR